MYPPPRKTTDIADLKPARSGTRAPDSPLDLGAEVSFSEVEPAAFRDVPNWSLLAAVSDPDVEDTIGGE